jgi:probable addiction module antidote protein
LALELRDLDASLFLTSEEAMSAYLEEAMDSGDARTIAGALGDVARAKGMAQLAKDSGMSRESLYRALSDDGNPQLVTVLKVLEALGLQLKVQPKRPDAAE